MKLGSKRLFVAAAATAVFCLLRVASTNGQAVQAEQPPRMAEDVFKDIRVLRGTTAKQLMDTMGLFASSLNANCTFCHVEEAGGDWSRYADDHPNKTTARQMVEMVTAINRTYFWGRPVVTCYSCHRFGNRPKVIPNLSELYSEPPDEDPDEILTQAAGAPRADQVLDKFIQAVGGTEKLAGITSFVGRGIYRAFDDVQKYAVDLYAKAPNQRATIMHSPRGDRAMVYDGRTAWDAVPSTDRPFDLVLPLDGDDLYAARFLAELSFPGRIKQSLVSWRVATPITVDGRDLVVVQGTNPGGAPMKLYFDDESGLLVRVLRYTTLPLGRVPTQVDFDDYRDVSGVKFPFHWRIRWTDGELVFDLNELRTNVPIDASTFGKPAVPVPPVTR